MIESAKQPKMPTTAKRVHPETAGDQSDAPAAVCRPTQGLVDRVEFEV
jgi:hypothetical protein